MPFAGTDDGIELYFEEAGSGEPIVFIHEFGGDHRSWEPQVRHFSRHYRCLVFAARGYPPSDVPRDVRSYGQERAVADVASILDAAGVDKAFLVGNSMGAFCALHFALRFPARTLGAVVAGCGYGAHPDKQGTFRSEAEKLAASFEEQGSAAVAQRYGVGPARVQFRAKDPRGHLEHLQVLAEHDPVGAALTMRGVQMTRPSLYDMREELEACVVPVLVVAGDEDDGLLETNLMLKRTIPRCGLTILPRSGHVTNLEEPALFNLVVERFLSAVEHGKWGPTSTAATSPGRERLSEDGRSR